MDKKSLVYKFRSLYGYKSFWVKGKEFGWDLEFTLNNGKKIINGWHSWVGIDGTQEEIDMVMRDNLMCTLRELVSRRYYDDGKSKKIVYFKNVRII